MTGFVCACVCVFLDYILSRIVVITVLERELTLLAYLVLKDPVRTVPPGLAFRNFLLYPQREFVLCGSHDKRGFFFIIQH